MRFSVLFASRISFVHIVYMYSSSDQLIHTLSGFLAIFYYFPKLFQLHAKNRKNKEKTRFAEAFRQTGFVYGLKEGLTTFFFHGEGGI